MSVDVSCSVLWKKSCGRLATLVPSTVLPLLRSHQMQTLTHAKKNWIVIIIPLMWCTLCAYVCEWTWVMQQDNDLKHTSKSTSEWLKKNKLFFPLNKWNLHLKTIYSVIFVYIKFCLMIWIYTKKVRKWQILFHSTVQNPIPTVNRNSRRLTIFFQYFE